MTRALIVEDSRTQAKRLKDLLVRGGFEVTQAFDGLEGLEACRKLAPDVVVSDIVMPGIDGFELCRRLRAENETRALPVMLLTSLADPMDVMRALAAGATNYATKPYRDDDLLTRVRRMIAQGNGDSIQLQGEQIEIKADRGHVLQLLFSALEDARARNEELEESRAALERANSARDEMMGIVAHELRTPLTSLLLRTQMAKRKGTADWPALAIDVMASIEKGASRMVRIIDDLVQATQLDAGTLSIQKKPVDLVALARDVVQRPHDAGVEILLEAPSTLPMELDTVRIEQVLANFVSNAIKYARDLKRVEVSVIDHGGTAEVRVRDFGIGIGPAQQKKVFDRFYRTQAGQKTAAGLGLGLYISRKIVELHGGKIGVESVEGEGSTFYFTLPR
jgi:signal transduction histidine kinase